MKRISLIMMTLFLILNSINAKKISENKKQLKNGHVLITKKYIKEADGLYKSEKEYTVEGIAVKDIFYYRNHPEYLVKQVETYKDNIATLIYFEYKPNNPYHIIYSTQELELNKKRGIIKIIYDTSHPEKVVEELKVSEVEQYGTEALHSTLLYKEFKYSNHGDKLEKAIFTYNSQKEITKIESFYTEGHQKYFKKRTIEYKNYENDSKRRQEIYYYNNPDYLKSMITDYNANEQRIEKRYFANPKMYNYIISFIKDDLDINSIIFFAEGHPQGYAKVEMFYKDNKPVRGIFYDKNGNIIKEINE